MITAIDVYKRQVEQIRKDICVLERLHLEKSEDSEKNHLEEIQVHEQRAVSYTHLDLT